MLRSLRDAVALECVVVADPPCGSCSPCASPRQHRSRGHRSGARSRGARCAAGRDVRSGSPAYQAAARAGRNRGGGPRRTTTLDRVDQLSVEAVFEAWCSLRRADRRQARGGVDARVRPVESSPAGGTRGCLGYIHLWMSHPAWRTRRTQHYFDAGIDARSPARPGTLLVGGSLPQEHCRETRFSAARSSAPCREALIAAPSAEPMRAIPMHRILPSWGVNSRTRITNRAREPRHRASRVPPVASCFVANTALPVVGRSPGCLRGSQQGPMARRWTFSGPGAEPRQVSRPPACRVSRGAEGTIFRPPMSAKGIIPAHSCP